MACINIHIPACTLFLPTLSLTLHLPFLTLSSFAPSPSSHTLKKTHLHGTPCPTCQWESALWSKSSYFVSSRSDAEPAGSLKLHLSASWLLPLWLWRLHLLTFSVCLQAKLNPDRQLRTRIQAVNTERCHLLFCMACATLERQFFLCIVILLAHLSLYVCVG